MWEDVCQCSSPMEQMAVSLEVWYCNLNAETVSMHQRLFLYVPKETPTDAKQVCPVIFLHQIPPVQRDQETLLKQAKIKWPTWLRLKVRTNIRYINIINHKTWTLGVHITSLIFVFWGEISDIPSILENHWLSLHLWDGIRIGKLEILASWELWGQRRAAQWLWHWGHDSPGEWVWEELKFQKT